MQQYRNNRNNGNIYDLRKDLQHTPPDVYKRQVLLQVLFCRWKGRPLFAAAPLHRWLEKRGMSCLLYTSFMSGHGKVNLLKNGTLS